MAEAQRHPQMPADAHGRRCPDPQRRLVQHQIRAVRARRPGAYCCRARSRTSAPRRISAPATRTATVLARQSAGRSGAYEDIPGRAAGLDREASWTAQAGRGGPSHRAWRRRFCRARRDWMTAAIATRWTGWRRWRRCTSRTISRRSGRIARLRARPAAGRLLRYRLSHTMPPPARRFALPRAFETGGHPALRLPRPVLRISSPAGCASSRRSWRRARHRRPSGQRRQPLRPQRRRKRRYHHGLHRAGRTADGHALRRARSGRAALSAAGAGMDARQARKSCSIADRACWASRASAATCAICWQCRAARRAKRSICSSSASRARSARWRRRLGGLDGLVFTAGIGENSAEIQGGVAARHGLAGSAP